MADARPPSLRGLSEQPRLMWASIRFDGQLINGIGVTSAKRTTTGTYLLKFTEKVHGASYQATIRYPPGGVTPASAAVQVNPFDERSLLVLTWSLESTKAFDFGVDVLVIGA